MLIIAVSSEGEVQGSKSLMQCESNEFIKLTELTATYRMWRDDISAEGNV